MLTTKAAMLALACALLVSGCGARQPGPSIANYARVVIDGEQMPDQLLRLRIGLARAGFTVVDAAAAAAEPAGTLRCQLEVREEAVRATAHLSMLDYATRTIVWEGRYSRKWTNTVARVIDAATDELRADYTEARATASR